MIAGGGRPSLLDLVLVTVTMSPCMYFWMLDIPNAMNKTTKRAIVESTLARIKILIFVFLSKQSSVGNCLYNNATYWNQCSVERHSLRTRQTCAFEQTGQNQPCVKGFSYFCHNISPSSCLPQKIIEQLDVDMETYNCMATVSIGLAVLGINSMFDQQKLCRHRFIVISFTV